MFGCALSLGLGLGIAPTVGTAVGFGKLSIESAIGEPLSVRVPLVSVQPGELEELGVALAAPGWYDASGLDYPDIASELILKLDLSDPAEPAVTVKTVNGVDQVAIPIMLELEWPQRVMRRQVTVLLNPAGYRPRQAANVSTGSEQAGDGVIEASGTIGYSSKTSGTLSGAVGAESMAYQPSAYQYAGTQLDTVVDRPGVVTLQSGDSLSTIVDRYLPDGASRFQGRMAFYDANAGAFRNGDINQIIRGAELIVPTVELILDSPAAESRRRYADLIEAARITRSQSNESNQDDAADTSSGGQASATANTVGAKTGGFRLSLLEVENPELLEQQSATAGESRSESSVRSGQSGQISGQLSEQDAGAAQSGDLSQAGLGAEDFVMQGFSMKLTVMNAYIVELQDENRQLKNRVATLEQKVEQLILRSKQPVSDLVADSGGLVRDVVDSLEGGSTSPEIGGDQAFVSEPALTGLDESTGDSVLTDGVNAEVVNSESEFIQQPLDQQLEQQPGTSAASEDATAALIDSDIALADDGALNTTAANPVADAADGETAVQEATVIPGSAAVNQVATAEGLGVETTSPRLVYRDSLLQQAKQFVQRFNTPLVQLIAAIAALGLGLLLWMLFRDRKRYRLADEFQEEDDSLLYDENVGVSYVGGSGDEITQLDMDDDPWISQANIGEAELDNLPDSDVDLITQSEVYLTYNRPVQAVEVLQEEYNKQDSDKFVVATRILRIFEEMGQQEERNLLLRNFIVTLNGDIEEFTSGEWDALRHDLNALRRTEHLSAVGDSQQLGSMDERQDDDQSDEAKFDADEQPQDERATSDQSRPGIEGFGTVESTNAPANDLKISRDDSELEYTAPDQQQKDVGDDGVVELTYTSPDKAQSR